MYEHELKRILQEPKKEINYDCLIMTVVGFLAGMFLVTILHRCQPVPALIKSHGELLTIRQIQMAEYFRKSGNKHPELMAEAVLVTEKPKLMAAIAVKGERNTPYTVRRGGYKKRHAGAFQVNEKIHGFAGVTPLQQALKAESILDKLIIENKNDIKKALNAYGGDVSKRKYASVVLNELVNIP